MSLLGVSQLRFLTRTPWSTLTVLVGVTLGVASVVAVHQISLRVTDFLNSATPPHLAGLTHLLERDSGTTVADDYFALRERWRRGELPGVGALLPIVEGQTVIGGRRTVIFAADWLAADGLQGDSAPIRGGSSGLDGLVVDSSLGLAVGDLMGTGDRQFRVAGVVETGAGPAVFADIGVGQALLGVGPEAVSYVGARKLDPLQRFKDALEAVLPGVSAGFDAPADSWRVDGWRVRRVESELPTLGFARSVIFNLGALGSLALVVAWFLIYQVGVIWHRRRRRLTDRLLAMGVTRRELTQGFVGGFAVLGLLATLLGLFAGMLLARVLSGISTAGLEAPGALPGLTLWVMAKAAFSGIGVSCLGGWMACRREWSSNGTHQSAPAGPRRAWRWLGPAVLVLILAGGVWEANTGLLGGFAAVLAVSLLVVVCVRPLLEHLRRMSARLPGKLLTRIGLREVTWYPRDLSIAVGALSLAVATSMGVGLMVDSFRADFSAMLDQRLAHDLFVDGDGRDLSGPRAWADGQPEVVHVQAYGRSRERVLGQPVELGFTRFSATESARYGLRRGLGLDEAMVSERLAGAANLRIGDRVEIRGRSLHVAAVFRGFGEAGYRMLVDDATAGQLGLANVHDRLSMTLTGAGREHGEVELADRLLARFSDEIPGLEARPRGSVRTLALDIFDRTFAITTALTLLALLVAVIGMYNALLALRLNQAPSYRLLGALGVAAAEQRGIALRRAAAVGCLAVGLALPLGIAMAWLLCHVINPRAFGWSLTLHLTPAEILVPLSLGLLAALLAGLLPMPGEGEVGYEEA